MIPRFDEIAAVVSANFASVAYLSLLRIDRSGIPTVARFDITPETAAKYGVTIGSETPSPDQLVDPRVAPYLAAIESWLNIALVQHSGNTQTQFRVIVYAPKAARTFGSFDLTFTPEPRTPQVSPVFGAPPQPFTLPGAPPQPTPPTPALADVSNPSGSQSDDEWDPDEEEDDGDEEEDDPEEDAATDEEEGDEGEGDEGDEEYVTEGEVAAPTQEEAPRRKRRKRREMPATPAHPLAHIPPTPIPAVVHNKPMRFGSTAIQPRAVRGRGYLRLMEMQEKSVAMLHQRYSDFGEMTMNFARGMVEIASSQHASAIAQIDGLHGQTAALVDTLIDTQMHHATVDADAASNREHEETVRVVGKAGIEQVGGVVKAAVTKLMSGGKKNDATDDEYVTDTEDKKGKEEKKAEEKRETKPPDEKKPPASEEKNSNDAQQPDHALPSDLIEFLRKNPHLVKQLQDEGTQKVMSSPENVTKIAGLVSMFGSEDEEKETHE